jgi:hypothetical protein
MCPNLSRAKALVLEDTRKYAPHAVGLLQQSNFMQATGTIRDCLTMISPKNASNAWSIFTSGGHTLEGIVITHLNDFSKEEIRKAAANIGLKPKQIYNIDPGCGDAILPVLIP